MNVESAPPAVGPYSHAVRTGGLLFLSGQIPAAPDGSGVIEGSFEDQVRRVLDNMRIVLEECESSLEGVVKTTVFLADMDQFGAFNTVYAEYFPSNPPARSCVQAARLPLGVPIEIEAIAIVS